MPAKSARSFGDSIGVNVRLTYLDTPAYDDFGPVEARLRELGVRYVSDSLCPTCTLPGRPPERLAALGIKANLGVGWLSGGPAIDRAGLQARPRPRCANSVASLSGSQRAGPLGRPATGSRRPAPSRPSCTARRRRTPFLSALPRARAEPRLPRAPAPRWETCRRRSTAATCTPIRAACRRSSNLDDERALMAPVSKDKPLADHRGRLPHRPRLPGAAPAGVGAGRRRSTCRGIALEAFRCGVERTYIYQFADLWSPADAAAARLPALGELASACCAGTSSPSRPSSRCATCCAPSTPTPRRWRPRAGCASASRAPGPTSASCCCAPPTAPTRWCCGATSASGTATAQRDLAPAPERVDVALGQPISAARRFDPVSSDDDDGELDEPAADPVDLAGTPVVLRLAPRRAPPPRAAARSR